MTDREKRIPETEFPSSGQFKFKNDTSHKYRVFFALGSGGSVVPAPPEPGTPHDGDALDPGGVATAEVGVGAGVSIVAAYIQDVTAAGTGADEHWWKSTWNGSHGVFGLDWILAEAPAGDAWPCVVMQAGQADVFPSYFQPTTKPSGA